MGMRTAPPAIKREEEGGLGCSLLVLAREVPTSNPHLPCSELRTSPDLRKKKTFNELFTIYFCITLYVPASHKGLLGIIR